MPCNVIPNGKGVIIACGGSRKPKQNCGWCSAPGDYLCDDPEPVGYEDTCSAPMCNQHRTRGADGNDYCPDHKAHAPHQESLVK